MPPEDEDRAHLWDMLQAARDVSRILGRVTSVRFQRPEQEKTRLSVERKLEVLGEAARRVSSAFRDAHPEVPWKDIVGLRNVISHQYDKVDYAAIYAIARNRIPNLILLLEPLVPEPPQDAVQG